MKTLEQMSNVERAELLFSLFPECMATVIASLKEGAKETLDRADELMVNWKLQLIGPETWLSISRDLLSEASKLGDGTKLKPRQVAYLLFEGYMSLVAVHLIKGCKLPPQPKALIKILW